MERGYCDQNLTEAAAAVSSALCPTWLSFEKRKCWSLSHVQPLRPYGLYSPPGSSVQRIFQTRILEWVAIPFSRRTSWSRDQTRVSCTGDRFFTRWASQEVADLDLICSISVFWKAWSNFLDLRMLTILGKNFRSQDSERQVRMTFSLTVNIGHHVLKKEQETEHTESWKMHLGVPFITKSTM